MTQTVSNNATVMIVENDKTTVKTVLQCLAERAIIGTVINAGRKLEDYIDRTSCKLALLGCGDSDDSFADACDKLQTIRQTLPEAPVVLISQSDSSDLALGALRAGFADFIPRPALPEKIHGLLDTYCPNHKANVIAEAQCRENRVFKIIGKSPALEKTVRLAARVAPTSAPVLINGESGTGKELIAQLIHSHSKRRTGPFIKVNCAALSDSLLESELFGHEKGAFTGATATRKGRFERANRGTLLLDEITETSPRFQAHLLRVLEQMDLERVGASETIQVNVRIISTTNKNIAKMVKEGKFRADLYYRLSAVRLTVPPLRSRTEDLEELVWHFINAYTHETPRKITALDPCMMDIFTQYRWPGNIRQLRNMIRTAMTLGTGPTLSIEEISWLDDEFSPECPDPEDELIELAGMNLQQLEQQAIIATLKRYSGNQAKTAKVLGISDRTLRDKIKKYRTCGAMS